MLTGAAAEVAAAGGIVGVEGSVVLAVSRTAGSEQAAADLPMQVASEPLFESGAII